MRIALSSWGYAALASALALSILALASRDQALAVAALSVWIALALDLLRALRLARSPCIARAASPEVKLWAGERASVRIELSCRAVDSVEVRNAVARVSSVERVDRDKLGIDLELDPRYCGRYRVEELVVTQRPPLRLFGVLRRARLGLNVVVFPRAWFLALVALALLGGRGLGLGAPGELSELPSQLRSLSGVYYSSREYQPGDPIVRIDWKASSRLLKLVIKEFREEASRSMIVVLDDRCLGPRTCDLIASTMLSIAIASYLNSLPLSVYVRSVDSYANLDPPRALAFAVRKALEMTVSRDLDLYELLEPPLLDEVKRLLSIDLGFRKASELRKLSRVALPSDRVVLVSTLVVDTARDLELVSELRKRGLEVYIYTPSRPWLDLESVEDAYLARKTHRLAIEKALRLGSVVRSVDYPAASRSIQIS